MQFTKHKKPSKIKVLLIEVKTFYLMLDLFVQLLVCKFSKLFTVFLHETNSLVSSYTAGIVALRHI